MKVTYEFDVYEDKESLEIHQNALPMYLALSDFKQYLRNRLKHEDMSEDKYDTIDEVFDRFIEILNENEVRL